jgi:hypothetical protein
MRSLMISTFLRVDRIEKNEMGGARSAYAGGEGREGEMHIKGFGEET